MSILKGPQSGGEQDGEHEVEANHAGGGRTPANTENNRGMVP
jgi:hypothetical protein